MFGLGIQELVVILVVVVVMFGGKKLPEIGTGLGMGIKNFRKAYREAKAIDITGAGDEERSGAHSGAQSSAKSES